MVLLSTVSSPVEAAPPALARRLLSSSGLMCAARMRTTQSPCWAVETAGENAAAIKTVTIVLFIPTPLIHRHSRIKDKRIFNSHSTRGRVYFNYFWSFLSCIDELSIFYATDV